MGLRAHLAGYLRAEQELGRIAQGISVEAAATMIVGACHELVLPPMFFGSTATSVEVPPGFVDDLVVLVMNGLAPVRSS
jgi:hypothetical protein